MLADTLYRLMLYGFLMVLFACFYAILYALGRVSHLPSLQRLSYGFGVLEFLSGLGMVASDYLDTFWRVLILFSIIAYLFIPPIMWRVVVAFHER
ncbi:hypothetical protein HRbin13_00553 [bacterium HR13]|nr:hypothetical protein HRbin13_00553 [bacterium HR13]